MLNHPPLLPHHPNLQLWAETQQCVYLHQKKILVAFPFPGIEEEGERNAVPINMRTCRIQDPTITFGNICRNEP
jgi:hypothetical protein